MIADFKVLLDACVLANFPVCDLYLRLVESPRLLIPKWSEEILVEVHRIYSSSGSLSRKAHQWSGHCRVATLPLSPYGQEL